MLIEFDVTQAEPVITLVHGRSETAVKSVDQLRALVGILRVETPVQRCTHFKVFSVVIHQINLLITRAEEIAQSPRVAAAISGIIENRLVLITIYIDRIVSAWVIWIDLRSVHRIVVRSLPIIGRKPEGVYFEAQDGIAIVVCRVIGITECQFIQLTFSHSHRSRHTRKLERGFGLHRNHPIERARTIKCGARTRNNVNAFHIQIRRPQEISKGKIQAWTLVVDSVNQLQRANGRRRIETPRIDDFETEAGRRHVDTFQVAEAFVK